MSLFTQLSITGNVGRVCLVYGSPFLLNQRVSKLVPVETFDWAMTYCMFREQGMRVKLEQLSNGVAQQNLSAVLASKMEFAQPPQELRQSFAVIAEPIVRRRVQLYCITQNVAIERVLDDRIFADRIEAAPGMWSTGLIQTYLDLTAAGERGSEAAEHLRKTRIEPSWKRLV